jgi:hypothetical protein
LYISIVFSVVSLLFSTQIAIEGNRKTKTEKAAGEAEVARTNNAANTQALATFAGASTLRGRDVLFASSSSPFRGEERAPPSRILESAPTDELLSSRANDEKRWRGSNKKVGGNVRAF